MMVKAISSLLLILSVLLFLSFAEAASLSSPRVTLKPSKTAYAKALKNARNPLPNGRINTILTHAQFLKLSEANQEIYILGLQKLILEIADEDRMTTYQTAQNVLGWLLPEAVAGDEDHPCVYAGWISEMDINGRYCLAPKSEGCGRGRIQCNPMLYGSGKCVSSGRTATASCERSKKTPAQIASEIRAKDGEQEWSNMRDQLSKYCDDPRPAQAKVCAMIRNQLARLDRVMGEVPALQYASPEDSQDAPAAVAAVAKPAGDAEKPSPQPIVVSPVKTAAPPAPASPDDIRFTRSSGRCQPESLLANMRAESLPNSSSAPFAQSTSFMDLESAKTVMCTMDPISNDWVKWQRNFVAEARGALRGNDKYANADRKNYDQILKNFNACLRDAETLRRTGAGSIEGQSATVLVNGTHVKIYDANHRVIVEDSGLADLEGLLSGRGISVCNIRIQNALPDGSSSHLGPRSSSGSAQ